MTDASLPRELYEIGGVFIHGKDKDGNVMLFCRTKYSSFPRVAQNAMERANYYIAYKVLEIGLLEDNDCGWIMVIDFTDTKPTQFDPQMSFSLLKMLHYMPAGLKRILLFNLPWYGKPLLNLILSLVPSEWRKIVRIVNLEQILTIIPNENLPLFFQFPDAKYENEVPNEAKPLDEIDLEIFGLKPKDKKVFKKYLEKMQNL
ncbi:motile sperm domain containing-like protein [Dinothrombium tinctorium]|uniref:Motile sperm domain containing-like protein n=1 Tax=Dinothrombium tinctorium TaxID=1965070 RepID=A0A3S3PK50_9ACAR|nr:motile sperm domain containing-like protein [Dinothrombium tinctorium]